MPAGQDLTNGGNALFHKRRITGDYSGIKRSTGMLLFVNIEKDYIKMRI